MSYSGGLDCRVEFVVVFSATCTRVEFDHESYYPIDDKGQHFQFCRCKIQVLCFDFYRILQKTWLLPYLGSVGRARVDGSF